MTATALWAQKAKELDAEEAKCLRKLKDIRQARRSLDDTIDLAKGLDSINESKETE